jgi:hypothetical protein
MCATSLIYLSANEYLDYFHISVTQKNAAVNIQALISLSSLISFQICLMMRVGFGNFTGLVGIQQDLLPVTAEDSAHV